MSVFLGASMTTAYFNLASANYFQDWSNAGQLTTSDDWSGVPSIVGYRGEGSEKMIGEGADMRMVEDGKWDAAINLTPTLRPTGEGGAPGSVSVFHPFTTTLIELKLNREPLPPVGRNKVLWWKGERAT